MSRILALETSGEACSVALWVDGHCLERAETTPRQHSRLLLPMVEALLAEAELSLARLDALAFGRGPGSFTGLRISAGVVQGLALGAQLPVIPVSTLAAVADERLQAQPEAAGVLALLDARMDEVYWGLFRAQGGTVQLLGAERVSAPEALLWPQEAPEPPSPAWLGAGSGWQLAARLPQKLKAALGPADADCLPRAAAVARLATQAWARGEQLPPEAAQPVYLRDSVVQPPGR